MVTGERLVPGARVLVPFGSSSVVGTVVEVRRTSRARWAVVSVVPEGSDGPVLSLHDADSLERADNSAAEPDQAFG